MLIGIFITAEGDNAGLINFLVNWSMPGIAFAYITYKIGRVCKLYWIDIPKILLIGGLLGWITLFYIPIMVSIRVAIYSNWQYYYDRVNDAKNDKDFCNDSEMLALLDFIEKIKPRVERWSKNNKKANSININNQNLVE